MGNCISLLKKKDSSSFESILYPLTLERRANKDDIPAIPNRYDSISRSKDNGQTLARIYSLYLDVELKSINEELSLNSQDFLNDSKIRSARSRTFSQDTMICSLTNCKVQISDNIFKCNSKYCDKHAQCKTCGQTVVKGKEFVVVSGYIYCKGHIRQYNTL